MNGWIIVLGLTAFLLAVARLIEINKNLDYMVFQCMERLVSRAKNK